MLRFVYVCLLLFMCRLFCLYCVIRGLIRWPCRPSPHNNKLHFTSNVKWVIRFRHLRYSPLRDVSSCYATQNPAKYCISTHTDVFHKRTNSWV